MGSLSAAEAIPARRGPLVADGVRRAVRPTASLHPSMATLPDGRSALVVSFRSPGAVRLRVHFRNFDVGAGEVWVYAPGSAAAEGPYTGKGIFGSGEFWSSGVDSDTVAVTYIAAANTTATSLPFVVDALVHQWSTAAGSATVTPDAGTTDPSSSCNLDVTCFPQYQTAATALVRYDFVADTGGAFLCSGSLINTRSNSFKPYLLTAHHCISSNSEAQSINASFLYQTATCNGTPPMVSQAPLIQGGQYLAGGDISQGDFSLVQLSRVPDGVAFLGWNTSLDPNAQVTGLHHPYGSYSRISFGSRQPDEDLIISGDFAPSADFYQVEWTSGLTEAGSSGSPLLNADGQLVGTLTGGPPVPTMSNSCDVTPTATYGRFSAAYPNLKSYLEDASLPALNVDTSSLTFQVQDGAVAGASQQFATVTTPSTSPLSLIVAADQPWVQLPATAVVSSSAPAVLPVSIDASKLTTGGAFTATVTVTSSSAVRVSFTVRASVSFVQSRVTVSVSPNPVPAADLTAAVFVYTISIRETAGVATRITGLKIGPDDLTSQIAGVLGTTRLNALGIVQARVSSSGITPPATLTIEVDGIDTASGRTWTATTPVSFVASGGRPVLTLSSSPSTVRSDPAADSSCRWSHMLILRETGGAAVQLTRFLAAGYDLSPHIGKYFGSARLPANGTLTARLCWSGISTPATAGFELDGADDNGNPVTVALAVAFAAALSSPPPLAVAPDNVALQVDSSSSGPATAQVAISLDSSTPWTATLTGSNANWLSADTLAGTGSGTITLTANPAGLSTGIYSANLIVQSPAAYPQYVVVPVSLQVGPPGPAPTLTTAGMVNGASFQAGAAPGMILSIFGANLANDTEQASSVPLPLSLGGVSVSINGVSAPLYFVSPTQLNVQVPVEVTPGSAQVRVNVNGEVNTAPLSILPAAPGLFTDSNGKLVPNGSGHRGDELVLYVTGQGDLTPVMPTGNAPAGNTPLAQLPRPVFPLTVTVGGIPVTPDAIDFAGVPYGLVGVVQINYHVPADAPTGDQPVVVNIGGQPSQTATLTINP